MGVIESVKLVFMKDSISFSFLNVNVGFVFKTMNTLLLLVFTFPESSRPLVVTTLTQIEGDCVHL